jgi:hypothetical protein
MRAQIRAQSGLFWHPVGTPIPFRRSTEPRSTVKPSKIRDVKGGFFVLSSELNKRHVECLVISLHFTVGTALVDGNGQ